MDNDSEPKPRLRYVIVGHMHRLRRPPFSRAVFLMSLPAETLGLYPARHRRWRAVPEICPYVPAARPAGPRGKTAYITATLRRILPRNPRLTKGINPAAVTRRGHRYRGPGAIYGRRGTPRRGSCPVPVTLPDCLEAKLTGQPTQYVIPNYGAHPLRRGP